MLNKKLFLNASWFFPFPIFPIVVDFWDFGFSYFWIFDFLNCGFSILFFLELLIFWFLGFFGCWGFGFLIFWAIVFLWFLDLWILYFLLIFGNDGLLQCTCPTVTLWNAMRLHFRFVMSRSCGAACTQCPCNPWGGYEDQKPLGLFLWNEPWHAHNTLDS